jgi:hypothetical protein
MSDPLDLRAVEQGLEYYETPPGPNEIKHYTTEATRLAGEVRALLAALRETRKALESTRSNYLHHCWCEVATINEQGAIKHEPQCWAKLAVLARVSDDVRSPQEAL